MSGGRIKKTDKKKSGSRRFFLVCN